MGNDAWYGTPALHAWATKVIRRLERGVAYLNTGDALHILSVYRHAADGNVLPEIVWEAMSRVEAYLKRDGSPGFLTPDEERALAREMQWLATKAERRGSGASQERKVLELQSWAKGIVLRHDEDHIDTASEAFELVQELASSSLPREALVPEQALARIVDYLWDEEAANYVETSPLEDRENHVFRSLEKVAAWLRQRQELGENQMGTKPVHTFNVHAVRVAIFENQSKNGPFHSVVMTKLYKDGNDWKETRSFFVRDLDSVPEAARIAQTKIQELEKLAVKKEESQNPQKEKGISVER